MGHLDRRRRESGLANMRIEATVALAAFNGLSDGIARIS